MNTTQPLGPSAAQQFVQDRLGLVVEGVRGGDGVRVASRDQFPEKRVAKVAGGLLQGFMEGRSGSGCIHAMQMERQAVGCGEAAHKDRVFLGGDATNTVMDVGDG